MPPLPNVTKTIKLEHHFLIGTDVNAVVRWFLTYTGGPPSAADLNSICQQAYTHFATDCIGLFPASTAIIELHAIDLDSSSGAEGSYSTTTVGTRVGATLAAGTAVLVNQPIARRYRGGKSRTYWPFGVAADLTDAQDWSSGFITSVQGNLETYYGHLVGLTHGSTVLATLVNVGYYHGFTAVTNPITGRTRDVPTPKAGPITPDLILGIDPKTKVASQRRRNLQRA